MTTTTTEQQIDALKQRIANSKKSLPYADGPNYFNQKNQIADMQAELKALETGEKHES